MSQMTAIGLLPFMMLDPAWVEQSVANNCGRDDLAIGHVRLLIAAWRGCPAGSIPNSLSYVAKASGLSEEVASEHWDVLMEGFVFRQDNRAHHSHIANLVDSVMGRYGSEIEDRAVAVAMAAQDQDAFGLPSASRRAGRSSKAAPLGSPKALPKDFALTAELIEFGRQHQLGVAQVEWLFGKWLAEVHSRSIKSADWNAEFCAYLLRYEHTPALRAQLPVDQLFAGEASAVRAHGVGRADQARSRMLARATQLAGRGGR